MRLQEFVCLVIKCLSVCHVHPLVIGLYSGHKIAMYKKVTTLLVIFNHTLAITIIFAEKKILFTQDTTWK